MTSDFQLFKLQYLPHCQPTANSTLLKSLHLGETMLLVTDLIHSLGYRGTKGKYPDSGEISNIVSSLGMLLL